MKNIQKNKKSWFKGLVVAGVFAISVLNLSVDFNRNAEGDIDLTSLSVTSQQASAESGGSACHMVSTNRCMVTSYFDYVCWCRISQGHYGLRS